jgi:hypothetical protein
MEDQSNRALELELPQLKSWRNLSKDEGNHMGTRTEKTDPTFSTSGVERVLYECPYDVSIIKKI